MQERVSKLVGREGQDIVSTFHSMCVRILRRDIERIGFTSNFSILGHSTDQLSVIERKRQHRSEEIRAEGIQEYQKRLKPLDFDDLIA